MLGISSPLKKIVSILLVLLLLFNALGFYGLFLGLRYKTTSDLVRRLDNQQYVEEETITLKVPISIPYQLDSEVEYERVDGEIEHEGEFFRMVKQKLENDTLYIVCIKDNESKRIKQALADYVKTFTDKPVNAKHSGKVEVNFIKDFLPSKLTISHLTDGWTHAFYFPYEGDCDLLNTDHFILSPPPKA